MTPREIAERLVELLETGHARARGRAFKRLDLSTMTAADVESEARFSLSLLAGYDSDPSEDVFFLRYAVSLPGRDVVKGWSVCSNRKHVQVLVDRIAAEVLADLCRIANGEEPRGGTYTSLVRAEPPQVQAT